MKKIILILSLSIALISCSNESKMKSGIKDYFDKNAKDPKSYEFVELKVFDTLTIGKIAKEIIESNNLDIQSKKSEIEIYNKSISELPSMLDIYKKDLESAKSIIKMYEEDNIKLKKFLNSKEIVLYNASHKYRLKNGFGALDLSTNNFVFDKDFKVVKMATENDPVFDINAGYCYEHYFDKK